MRPADTIASFEATPLEAFACLADRALAAAALSCLLVAKEAGAASTFIAWIENRQILDADWERAERAQRNPLKRWASSSATRRER